MIIREAIVLAGGMGTRLREALPELPKCMAPINGKPFLQFVIKHLQSQGIQNFVFALGYKAESIIKYLKENESWINARYTIEDKPLGTGGAIKNALQFSTDNNLLIVNGDTFFKANFQPALQLHHSAAAACTLVLKPLPDCSRYGAVLLDETQRLKGFGEKEHYGEGLINGGMYLLNKLKFLSQKWPDSFSFEKEWLQEKYKEIKMMGIVQDAYFIDIGIPEDLARARLELRD